MQEILENIGSFGRYQKMVLLITGLCSILSSGLIYSIIFITASPYLECHESSQSLNISTTSLSLNQENVCILWQKKSNECRFDSKYYGQTAVTELELVCEKKYSASISQTLLLLGQVSSVVLGYLSDRFGRKRSLLLSTWSAAFILAMCSLTQLKILNFSLDARFVVFCITQYLVGMLSAGLYSILFIILVEITTEKYKTIATIFNMYMYVIGQFIAMIVYYVSRDWKVIYYFLAAYSVVISLSVYLILLESPLYLLKMQKYKEAYTLLKRIAELNGKIEIDESEQSQVLLNINNQLKEDRNFNRLKQLNSEEPNDKFGICSYIFRSRKNVFTVFALCYIWLSICLVFFGISLGITNIGDMDPYVSYSLSSASEIIAYSLCFFNDKFGRKRMLVIFLSTSSLVCLIVALIPVGPSTAWLVLFCASVGKTAAAAAFVSCSLYSNYFFPTHVQTTMVLFVCSMGRLGSVISPQINLLGQVVWTPLPYFIYSGGSFIGNVFICLLPSPELMSDL